MSAPAQARGWLALSHERDLWMARLDAAWRQAYRAGFAQGRAAGRAEAEAEQAASWREVAGFFARNDGELERRRWAVRGEPRTRAEFSQPAPGDYPGKRAAA
jgi:hypothetical protein